MVLNLLQISLNIFAIFLLQGCIQTHAGCPFSRGKRGAESFASEAEIVALLKERFNASIYSKGLDFETRVRDNPTKKNLFGACPSEKCLPSAKFRTFSGYCNNLKSSLSFGGRASRLKRLLVKCWIFFSSNQSGWQLNSAEPSHFHDFFRQIFFSLNVKCLSKVWFSILKI